jgi:hypothetical protein
MAGAHPTHSPACAACCLPPAHTHTHTSYESDLEEKRRAQGALTRERLSVEKEQKKLQKQQEKKVGGALAAAAAAGGWVGPAVTAHAREGPGSRRLCDTRLVLPCVPPTPPSSTTHPLSRTLRARGCTRR